MGTKVFGYLVLDGYYKEWLGIREVLKQMPPEDQARVKDFAELLDLYDLN